MSNIKDQFASIYKTNYWNSNESRSGGGSEVRATVEIRQWLLEMIAKYKITSMVDCACGDFNWMRRVIFPLGFRYIGIDIVDEMIHQNVINYENPERLFLCRDMTTDILPRADLLFCKDVFLHLSFEHIQNIIDNFKRSGSKYLIVSNGIGTRVNEDKVTGGSWRVVNLQEPPFRFKPYLELLDVGFTQMTLHKLSDLQ